MLGTMVLVFVLIDIGGRERLMLSSSSPKQNALSIADIGRSAAAIPCPSLFHDSCRCSFPSATVGPCPSSCSDTAVLVLSPRNDDDFVGAIASIDDRASETESEPSCLDDEEVEIGCDCVSPNELLFNLNELLNLCVKSTLGALEECNELDWNDLGLILESVGSIMIPDGGIIDSTPFPGKLLSDGASSPRFVFLFPPSTMGKRDSSCWGVRNLCRGVTDRSDLSDFSDIVKALSTVEKQ